MNTHKIPIHGMMVIFDDKKGTLSCGDRTETLGLDTRQLEKFDQMFKDCIRLNGHDGPSDLIEILRAMVQAVQSEEIRIFINKEILREL